MKQSKEIQRLVEGKLRRPVHINYIAGYIFKTSKDEARNILKSYIDQGVVVESRHAKDYYVLKSQEDNGERTS